MESTIQKNSQYHLDLEAQYGAHDYHPLPVVLAKGEGVIYGMSKVKSTTTFCLPILP